MAKYNGFEAGSVAGEGVAVSTGNSSAAGEDAFSIVNTGTGGSIVYTASGAFIGNWCAQFTQPTAANMPVTTGLAEGAGSTDFAVRCYIYLSGYPDAASNFIQLRSPADGHVYNMGITTTGQIRMNNNSGTTFGGNSTSVMGLLTWYRAEMYGTGLNGSAGNITAAFYEGHSPTPVAAGAVINSTAVVTPATVDRVRFGRLTANNLAPWKMDGLGISLGSATPMGPAVVSQSQWSYTYAVTVGG